MTNKTREIVSSVLAGVNIVGTFGVFISTLVYAPKAKAEVDKLKKENPNPKKSEILKAAAPKLAVPFSITVISAIAGGTSTILSRKVEASLGASIVALQQGYQRYSGKVKSLIGKAKNNEIIKKVAEDEFKANEDEIEKKKKADEELYYMDNVGYFCSTRENLLFAYSCLNQTFSDDSNYLCQCYIVSLGKFMRWAKARILTKGVTYETLDNLGWSIDYLSDMYEAHWIHMQTDSVQTKNGKSYTYVCFDIEPVVGYANVYYYDKDEYEDNGDLDFWYKNPHEDPGISKEWINNGDSYVKDSSDDKSIEQNVGIPEGVDAIDPDIEKGQIKDGKN